MNSSVKGAEEDGLIEKWMREGGVERMKGARVIIIKNRAVKV